MRIVELVEQLSQLENFDSQTLERLCEYLLYINLAIQEED